MSETAATGEAPVEVEGAGAGNRLRLFIALDLPMAVLEQIGAWQGEVLERLAEAGAPLRPMPPDSLHVTLAFLGRRPGSEVAAIAETLQGLSEGPVRGTLRAEAVPVPSRRPRLLALELESDAAIALQADLAKRLQALGVLRAERRPYWPHLTVFRARGRNPGPLAAAAGLRFGEEAGAGSGHAFGFVRVALYLSNLRPEGSSYTRLAANELPQ